MNEWMNVYALIIRWIFLLYWKIFISSCKRNTRWTLCQRNSVSQTGPLSLLSLRNKRTKNHRHTRGLDLYRICNYYLISISKHLICVCPSPRTAVAQLILSLSTHTAPNANSICSESLSTVTGGCQKAVMLNVNCSHMPSVSLTLWITATPNASSKGLMQTSTSDS